MRILRWWILALGAATVLTGFSGCESWHRSTSDRSAGRQLDDNHVTAQVRQELRSEPVYKFENVDVKTFEGVVQLSGFADTQEQIQRAGDIAQRVPGVERVINNIAQKPAPTGRTEPAPNVPPANYPR